MGMGQRRPPTGPSPYTAGRPNPMAAGGGLGNQMGKGWGGFNPQAVMNSPSYGSGIAAAGAETAASPWMRPPPPQMPPGGGGGVQVAQGQPPPGGWGSGGAPGYYPPGPQQAMPLLQAPVGMGGGGMPGSSFSGVAMNGIPYQSSGALQGGGGQQGMSDAMMHPFAPRNRGPQGVGPNMQGQIQNSLVGMQGTMGGGPMQQMQGALGQMQGAMGGGMRPQRRFPGALGRGIMQAMAPPPQAAPPAPYGGQQFRMW